MAVYNENYVKYDDAKIVKMANIGLIRLITQELFI